MQPNTQVRCFIAALAAAPRDWVAADRSAVVIVIVGHPAADHEIQSDVARHFGLTRREGQIALLLAQRLTTAEIAAELSLSRHTVRRHVEHILPKLGVNSRQAVRARFAELQHSDAPRA